ncbi:hypothetical protein [Marinagarivorans algicola]|uniref:hypothetical protein n=1 Tax=Marinagarivorans algicola TaxID=1513270 RepID=UPI0006B69EF8|nr:hypothetical protein [Marinagarivorans algicola]
MCLNKKMTLATATALATLFMSGCGSDSKSSPTPSSQGASSQDISSQYSSSQGSTSSDGSSSSQGPKSEFSGIWLTIQDPEDVASEDYQDQVVVIGDDGVVSYYHCDFFEYAFSAMFEEAINEEGRISYHYKSRFDNEKRALSFSFDGDLLKTADVGEEEPEDIFIETHEKVEAMPSSCYSGLFETALKNTVPTTLSSEQDTGITLDYKYRLTEPRPDEKFGIELRGYRATDTAEESFYDFPEVDKIIEPNPATGNNIVEGSFTFTISAAVLKREGIEAVELDFVTYDADNTTSAYNLDNEVKTFTVTMP